MLFPRLVLALALGAAVAPAGAQNSPAAGPISLTVAMQLAEEASVPVRLLEAQWASVEGARREAAAALFNNPELSFEGTRRRLGEPEGRANEWSTGIAQSFEIGGQQHRRREAAAASLEALRADIDDARRQARGDAILRFYAVLAAQRRLQIEERSFALFDRTYQVVAQRRAAGEDTRLDANVALIEVERSRNAVTRAREQAIEARRELAMLLQLPTDAVPEVTGDIEISARDGVYAISQLQASAQTLPRQRALSARHDAAKARLGLAQAGRLPDVTVGLNVGREGPSNGRERVVALTLTVPLPLFKRNDAAIGEAVTAATQVELERASTLRESQSQIARLWSTLQSRRERVQRLQRLMLAASTDNQQLTARSRQAGQIGLLDQLIVNRQALDAERDLVEALAEFHTTRIELENAAGWSQEGSLP